jgi:alanine racemase
MTQHVRPTAATIDLGRLQHNFGEVRKLVGPNTGVLAAVKGDAYGHGAVTVARALEVAGADWFGVALVEEGRTLRQAGVSRPIMCLGGVGPAGAEAAIQHRLTPMISDFGEAERIDVAAGHRREPYGVHLKVDTGMGRMGVPLPHWEGFLDRIANLRWLRVDGIASHLAVSECPPDTDGRVFTEEQGRRFLEAVGQARRRGLRPALLHLANSGAILEHPKLHFDLVRPGLLLYGYGPAGPECPVPVQPVMRIATRVLVVRDLPAGVGLSYGQTWKTPRPSRIATLPVGYADGYPRALSDRAEVLIHGHRAPLRGLVCMDLCMIDVTEVPVLVAPGDEVVLLGESGDDAITAWDLATWAETIPYEILAGFSERVPRVLNRDTEPI